MNFKMACGHTVTIMPWENFITVIRKGCIRCACGVK